MYFYTTQILKAQSLRQDFYESRHRYGPADLVSTPSSGTAPLPQPQRAPCSQQTPARSRAATEASAPSSQAPARDGRFHRETGARGGRVRGERGSWRQADPSSCEELPAAPRPRHLAAERPNGAHSRPPPLAGALPAAAPPSDPAGEAGRAGPGRVQRGAPYRALHCSLRAPRTAPPPWIAGRRRGWHRSARPAGRHFGLRGLGPCPRLTERVPEPAWRVGAGRPRGGAGPGAPAEAVPGGEACGRCVADGTGGGAGPGPRRGLLGAAVLPPAPRAEAGGAARPSRGRCPLCPLQRCWAPRWGRCRLGSFAADGSRGPRAPTFGLDLRQRGGPGACVPPAPSASRAALPAGGAAAALCAQLC